MPPERTRPITRNISSSWRRTPAGDFTCTKPLNASFSGSSRIGAKIPLLGLGFHKTTIDRSLHEVLLRHLRSNIHKFKSEPADAFLQTESATAYPSLLYHDEEFNQQLLRDLQGMHERWSGLSLKQAACYGIRVYQPGSYLYNHTDRPTHVVSSTICVDHRLTNRWPLYIEDLDGRAHEVPVEPGEIVFFEGARLQHGRPVRT